MRKLLLLGLIVLVIATVIASSRRGGPHDFTEKECYKCHVSPENNPSRLAGTVKELCLKCHSEGMVNFSHPVEVMPQLSRIPPDFPLRDGKITCNTCHNIHSGKRSLFGRKTYFLRRPNADMRFFCSSCHEEDPQNPGHLVLPMTAHIGRNFMVTDPAEPLDPLTIQCISCHDETIASGADYKIGEGVWNHIYGPHPIGADYREARMRGSGLTPVSRLDGRIRLFAGKIGCGTCHDMYSKHSSDLVMSNQESRLCSSCHYDK
jgi:predicted CXXCH cytochrome family protein